MPYWDKPQRHAQNQYWPSEPWYTISQPIVFLQLLHYSLFALRVAHGFLISSWGVKSDVLILKEGIEKSLGQRMTTL